MLCEHIQKVLERYTDCRETLEGTRIVTQCMYPSFDPVAVYVAGFGEGFKVHDGGGAIRSAWEHGRDMAAARRTLSSYAAKHELVVSGDTLVAEASTMEWVLSAVLSVANASSAVAQRLVEKASLSAEESLHQKIDLILRRAVNPDRIARNYEVSGRSGRIYGFDFAVRQKAKSWLLISGVTPFHASVTSRYVAFSDTSEEAEIEDRFSVYDRPLDQRDAALLQQVASLVPFTALGSNLRSELVQ